MLSNSIASSHTLSRIQFVSKECSDQARFQESSFEVVRESDCFGLRCRLKYRYGRCFEKSGPDDDFSSEDSEEFPFAK